jgi:glycosyltransferase involved in cell wall biosynthesis
LPERVLTVPMGVNPDPYREARRAAAEKHGGPPVIISTRKLEAIYNLDQLVEALPAIGAGDPRAEVVIVGDGPERSRLETRARASLGGRVTFTGMIPHGEIAARLGGAAVYVSTSLSDSTSVSLLEAMAAGAFPVVTDIEANREWIDDGVNGYLVPVGASGALAARVLAALADPQLRAGAAAENTRRIDTRAIWEKNMELVENRFARLIAERRQR